MGLWDKIRGEFIDIVEWIDSTRDTMVFRFERHGNEIKQGARLVVREGQAAAFINEGRLADVFTPGTYTLETKNLPILSTLQGWKYGFSSPFKAEVYFVSMRLFTDLKWGTKNPIMLRDPEFGPARIRAFGTYVIQVKDPGVFIQKIVGTEGAFTTDYVTEQLRNFIVSRFADLLGESKIPILDMSGNYDELGKFITGRLEPEFGDYGLNLQKLLIENISCPPRWRLPSTGGPAWGSWGTSMPTPSSRPQTPSPTRRRTPGASRRGASDWAWASPWPARWPRPCRPKPRPVRLRSRGPWSSSLPRRASRPAPSASMSFRGMPARES